MNKAPWRDRTPRAASPSGLDRLAVLAVVAFALRLAYVSSVCGLGHLPGESREYSTVARRLLESGTIASPFTPDEGATAPSCVMPPGYVVLVAGVYRLLGPETFGAILMLQLLNAAATSGAVLFVGRLAGSLAGPIAGWIAAVLIAVHPAVVHCTLFIWDTSLFTLAVALTVWIAHRLAERGAHGRAYLPFGLWLGGLALLNPALTIAYPLLVLWPITKAAGGRRRTIIPCLAAAALGWTLVQIPWTVRNHLHFRELIYVRCGLGMQLWLGTCPEASDAPDMVFDRQFPLRANPHQSRIRELGESAYLRERMQGSLKAIGDDPGRYVRLVALRAVDYWLGTVFTHQARRQGGWPVVSHRAAATCFLLGETLVVVVGSFLWRRWTVEAKWLAACAISFSVIYCLTHVEVRYRTPSEPIIAILVGLMIHQLWAMRGRRRISTAQV